MQNSASQLVSITGKEEPHDRLDYRSSVTSQRLIDPVMLFEQMPLMDELKANGGATAISAADILKSFQFHSELYLRHYTAGQGPRLPIGIPTRGKHLFWSEARLRCWQSADGSLTARAVNTADAMWILSWSYN